MLNLEEEMDNIAVGYLVVAAFLLQLARGFDRLLIAEFGQFAVAHDLGADKSAFDVGVDGAAGHWS